jgi:uncharacterized protein with NAD-binding domain and iron-sulfur cluster
MSAAYDLVHAGNQVTIFESSEAAGGLAGGFSSRLGLVPEKFYTTGLKRPLYAEFSLVGLV